MSRRAITARGSAAALRWPWCKAGGRGTASRSGRRCPTASSPPISARRSSTTSTTAGVMGEQLFRSEQIDFEVYLAGGQSGPTSAPAAPIEPHDPGRGQFVERSEHVLLGSPGHRGEF